VTQILVRVHPKYVLVLSDYLLTMPDGSVFADDATKMVFYEGSLILAYTGLARIGDEDTGLWIARTIAKYPSPHEALPGLAADLNARWPSLNVTDNRLTIMGAGAAPSDDGPASYIVKLSNCDLGQTGSDREFRYDGFTVPDDEIQMLVGGRPLRDSKSLFRNLLRAEDHNVSVLGKAELTARFIREQNDRRVGRDFLVTAGWKERLLERRTLVLSGGDLSAHHIAGFLPEDGRPEWRTAWMVSGGAVGLGGGGAAEAGPGM
jgi:hypothetical protein